MSPRERADGLPGELSDRRMLAPSRKEGVQAEGTTAVGQWKRHQFLHELWAKQSFDKKQR